MNLPVSTLAAQMQLGSSTQLNSPDKDQGTPFQHRWQIGEQVYVLDEAHLTSDLLSLEELRELSTNNSINVNVNRVEQSYVQLASYDEEAELPIDERDDAIESKEENATQENKTEKNQVEQESIVKLFAGKSTSVLKKDLDSRKEAILADTQLTDTVRSSQLQIISAANEAILRINEADGLKSTYLNEWANIEDAEQQLRVQLDRKIDPAAPEITENTSSETLVRRLKELRSELEGEKREFKEIEEQIEFHSDRVNKIPAERSEANEQIKQIQDEVTKRSAKADELDNQLELILLELRFRAADAVLKKLDVEVKRQELGTKIDLIKRDLKSRSVKRLEDEVQQWEKAVKKLRASELRMKQIAAREEASNAHVFLTPLAERNENLISDQESVLESIQVLKEELKKTNASIDSIVDRRTEIENKVEAAGLTATNGMLLVDLRRNLTTTGESHIRIQQLQTELRKLNLAKVGLNEERNELGDPVQLILSQTKIPEGHDLFPNAMEFVNTKREYLDQLINDYQSYGRTVSEVSEARKKLIDEVNETVAYIDENAIWIRSAEPIRLPDIQVAKEAVDQFFDLDQWAQIVANTQQRATQRPYESAFATLTLVTLMVFNRRMKFKLQSADSTNE